MDVRLPWILTNTEGIIVDATSAAVQVLNVPFHRLLGLSVWSFLLEGHGMWRLQLSLIEGDRRITRRTRIQPQRRPSLLSELSLQILSHEGRVRCAWCFKVIPRESAAVLANDAGRRCPGCSSPRVVFIELPHGVDCVCERCGYVWHCDTAVSPPPLSSN